MNWKWWIRILCFEYIREKDWKGSHWRPLGIQRWLGNPRPVWLPHGMSLSGFVWRWISMDDHGWFRRIIPPFTQFYGLGGRSSFSDTPSCKPVARKSFWKFVLSGGWLIDASHWSTGKRALHPCCFVFRSQACEEVVLEDIIAFLGFHVKIRETVQRRMLRGKT